MDPEDTPPNDRSDRPQERREADGIAGREAERTVPTDPYLLAGRGVQRLLAALNRAYDSFEDLPGWARVWFGTAAFLVSAYYGQVIEGTIDAVAVVLVTVVSGTIGKISLVFGPCCSSYCWSRCKRCPSTADWTL